LAGAARYIALGAALSAVIVIAFLAMVPSSYDFAPDNPLYNGLSQLVGRYGLIPVGFEGLGDLGPGSVVLVIGPGRGFTQAEALSLRSYVERGGVLVIADDFGSGNAVLGYMGVPIRFDGRLLSDPIYMYRNQRLPIVRFDINGSTYNVYLNYATIVNGSGGSCIGYSSPFSYLDENLNGVRDQGEPWGPFCVAYMARTGSGYIIAISDPSLFINSMLGLGDNSKLVERLISGRAAYILTGIWIQDRYSMIRSLVVGSLATAFQSHLRYPIVFGLAAAASIAVARIYRGGRVRGAVGDLEGLVEEVSSAHPDWDPEILRRLAEEVLGNGGRG